jgi:hypothetical protein
MNILMRIIIFTILSFLASCQVEEKAGSSGLISNHLPTTNSFTLENLTAKTYVSGEILSLNLTFPYPVIVDTSGGIPSLQLTIGSSTRQAVYVSGAGTTSLRFSYTIDPTDNDADGISFNSISLNGGTFTFDNQGVITNCSTTISSKTFSNVLVDNSGPIITAFDLTNFAGFYHLGEKISFTLTFDEPVYVSGTPSLGLEFSTPASSTGEAVYAGGTGTNSLLFSYTVPNDRADSDGYIIDPLIRLNAGTIMDFSGNNAALDFTAFNSAVMTESANVDFDGRLPYLISVTPPADGTYSANGNLDILLEFDREVNVSGSPYITVTIGSTARQATYYSGHASRVLTFRYVAVPGDIDTDGITISSNVTANSGNITGTNLPTNSFFGHALNNVLVFPSTAAVLVNAIQPAPISVSRNTDTTLPVWGTGSDETWNIGQQFLITVNFNTEMYVNQTSGTPYLPITIGSVIRNAPYLSGGNGSTSLVFSYTVVEGDLDSDGTVAVGDIVLNNGTITDINNTNSTLTIPSPTLTSTYIDGERPTINSVIPPANGTYSTVTGNNHLDMYLTVNWSEPVNYSSTTSTGVYIPLDIGGTTLNASYGSGLNTNSYLHWTQDLSGTNDSDGIVISSPLAGTATISDRAGNSANVLTFTPPASTGVLVDTISPTVDFITPPVSKTYTAGEQIQFTVDFSELVSTNVDGTYPRIAIMIGGTQKYLTTTTTGLSETHTFSYEVVSGDLDTDGITLGNSIEINGAGTVYDIALNEINGTYTLPNTTGIIVDGDPASINTINVPVTDTYIDGNILEISLEFSENVAVTGTPLIHATAQTGVLDFAYVAGTGTNTLTFRYTVQTTDFDFDGLAAISSINLNGGTIIGDNALNASTSFTSTAMDHIFISYPGIDVWSDHNISNRAASGTITLSSSAAAVTEACGNGTCRVFDGDDDLQFSTLYSNVHTVYVVFKTSTTAANYDIFPTDLSLVNDGGFYDLSSNGNVLVDNTPFSGPSPDTNLVPGSTHIVKLDLSSPKNFLLGIVIPSTFRGAIGDVIMVHGALTPTEETEIYNYLLNKY